MNDKTVRRLIELNREFYRKVGGEFDRTRRKPWPGWFKLLPYLAEGTIRVADIGCGNGRFGRFLEENYQGHVEYVGIDSDDMLLKIAQKGLRRMAARFERIDVLELEKSKVLDDKFEVIGVFGLMHHMPGYETRVKLLAQLTKKLKKDGVMIISFWRPDRGENCAKKTKPWKDDPKIDPTYLEAGDYLLRWNLTKAARYCHIVSEDELKRLKAELELKVLAEFSGDGKNKKMNDYLIVSSS